MVQDIAKSIRNRLLEQTRNMQGDYQQVIIRFVHERLMYRLAQSKYRQSFYLKGGSLLYALAPLIARPTLDIDFLGVNFPSNPERLRSVFEEICSQQCPEDGLIFDAESINVERIMDDREYKGLCVQVKARLDTIVQRVSIDVGFGDSVIGVKEIPYPTLLKNLPRANLFAYSMESVIAEKFHAMIMRDESNSRMKDFYDVYQILLSQEIDDRKLEKAIKATFYARKAEFNPQIKLFESEYAHDKVRLALWKNFLHKIKQDDRLDFEEVLSLICERLKKYWIETMFD